MYSFTPSFHLTIGFTLLQGPSKFTHIHFLHKLFTFLPLNITKQPESIFFHTFHYTTSLHVHKVPCHIFHCSHSPILSHNMFLSNHSFPHHILLNAVLYYMNKSLICTYVLTGEYCSLAPLLPTYSQCRAGSTTSIISPLMSDS